MHLITLIGLTVECCAPGQTESPKRALANKCGRLRYPAGSNKKVAGGFYFCVSGNRWSAMTLTGQVFINMGICAGLPDTFTAFLH